MKPLIRLFFIFFTVMLKMTVLLNMVHAQNNNIDIAKISQVVLYYTNITMESRINAIDLSNYIKDIVTYYNEYLLSKNHNNEASAIIVFAINPDRISRIWIVDNYSNSNNSELISLFRTINIPVVNNGPVAAAIYIGNINILNLRLDNNGIYVPDEWLEIIINNSNGQPMAIDAILNILFAQ